MIPRKYCSKCGKKCYGYLCKECVKKHKNRRLSQLKNKRLK